MQKTLRLATVALCLAAMPMAHAASSKARAIAKLVLRDGISAGTASFIGTSHGVLIEFDLKGLPAGAHAMHIHASGNCDAATGFTSAGPHFSFDATKEHGYLAPHGPHAGDLPNQVAGSDGTLRASVIDNSFSIGNGKKSIFDKDGASLIVTANADDYATQPDGHSGDRIACGVIERTVAPGGGRKGGKHKAHK
jgi:Cu-Zn family superoxide dismutase